jgi:hypothetical protein
MEKDEDDVLLPVPADAKICPDAGVCIQDGIVQFGLKQFEIDDVWERIQTLIKRVEKGKIPVF